jgi:quercetin dioxygenase-like cupin family protein
MYRMIKEDKDRLTQQPVLALDLNAEIAELRSHPALQTAGRVAKTLAVQRDFRIILTAIRKGTRINEHHVPGSISIHTLRGEIALHIQSQVTRLPAGSILILDQGMAHDVVAQEDSAFLVTISWPQKESSLTRRERSRPKCPLSLRLDIRPARGKTS